MMELKKAIAHQITSAFLLTYDKFSQEHGEGII